MASDEKYEFNAPKFVDFEAGDLNMGDTDHYFAYDHEAGGYVIEEDMAVATFGETKVESVHVMHTYRDSGMSGSEELHYESSKDEHNPEDEQFRAGSAVDDYELYEVQYACARRSSVCGAEEIVAEVESHASQPRRRSASVSNRDVLIAETPEVLQRIDARLGRKFVVVPEARRLNLELDQEASAENVEPPVEVSLTVYDDTHMSRLDRKFASMLRKTSSVEKYVKPQITETKPFRFASNELKSKPAAAKVPSTGNCVPLAEALLKLQKTTPQRFRSKPANSRPELPKTKPVHVTQARSPNFASDKRNRQVHVLSREEQEVKELEEMRKHQFKAHPVNPHVIKPRPVAAQPAKRPITRAEPFKLSEPHLRRVQVVQDKPSSHIFHARPAPMKALHAYKAERPRSPKCTVPQTPNFSAAGKAAMAARRRNLSGTGSTNSVNSVSNSSNHSDEGHRARFTKPQPFSFAEREKLMMARKQERIMKQLEEEQKALQVFHAQPLPDLSRPRGIPARPAPPTTQMKPFQLSTDTLGQQNLAKFYAEKAENERKAREAAQFKAHKPVVLEKDPFVPQRPGRILTEVAEFRLNTEVRAEKRMEFDEFVKEREQDRLAALREAEEKRLREEEEERVRLRAQAVIKANPIRHYKPVETKGSDRSLTIPETPHFHGKSARERKISVNENSFSSH